MREMVGNEDIKNVAETHEVTTLNLDKLKNLQTSPKILK